MASAAFSTIEKSNEVDIALLNAMKYKAEPPHMQDYSKDSTFTADDESIDSDATIGNPPGGDHKAQGDGKYGSGKNCGTSFEKSFPAARVSAEIAERIWRNYLRRQRQNGFL